MGVHGLLTYLVRTLKTQDRVELGSLAREIRDRTGKKAQLICDYLSVVIWLLAEYDQALIQAGTLPPYSIMYGGNVHEYGQRILNFVKSLESLGVETLFFVDGPPGSEEEDFVAKLPELKHRYLQKLQHCTAVQQVCGGKLHFLQIHWKLKEGVSTQVEMTLKSAGVKLVHCVGEADREIMDYLRTHDEACGVLSTDTDFAIASGSKFFLAHPKFFDVENSLGITSEGICKNPPDVSCNIITPEIIAKSLGINSTQLVDLSVLCGNDFTKDLNARLSPWAILGLSKPEVQVVAEWLQGQTSPLLENEEMASFFSHSPSYKTAVEFSYSAYLPSSQSEEDKSRQSRTVSPLQNYIQERVKSGLMSSCLLSMLNGIYWRSVVIEPPALGQPCLNDFTLLLRTNLYALMGLKEVKEYGRTTNKSFSKVAVTLDFTALNVDGLQLLKSLEQSSTNEKLATLFHLVTSKKEYRKHSDVRALLARGSWEGVLFESQLSGETVVACACLVFMQYVCSRLRLLIQLKICEIEALIVTCLLCVAEIPPCYIPTLPSARAIMLGMWFTHVLEQAYLAASFLGLSQDLPPPARIFHCLPYIPYHMVSFISDAEGDVEDQSEMLACPQLAEAHRIFDTLINSRPVLVLRAEILNKWKSPNLSHLLRLFSSALDDVKARRDVFVPRTSLATARSLPPEPDVSFGEESKITATQSLGFVNPPEFDLDSSLVGDASEEHLDSDSSNVIEYDELSASQEYLLSEEYLYLSNQSQSEYLQDFPLDDSLPVCSGLSYQPTADTHTSNTPELSQSSQTAQWDSEILATSNTPELSQSSQTAQWDSEILATSNTPELSQSSQTAQWDSEILATSNIPELSQSSQTVQGNAENLTTTSNATELSQSSQTAQWDSENLVTSSTPELSQSSQMSQGNAENPASSNTPEVSQMAQGNVENPASSNTPEVSQMAQGNAENPASSNTPEVSQMAQGNVENPASSNTPETMQGNVENPASSNTPEVSQTVQGNVENPSSSNTPEVSQTVQGNVENPSSSNTPEVSQTVQGNVENPASSNTPEVSQTMQGNIENPASSNTPEVSQTAQGNVENPASSNTPEVSQTVQGGLTHACSGDKRLPRQRLPVGTCVLPIMEHKEKILKLIRSHRVVCIEGEAGCGKSTKVPQFILDDSQSPQECKILITQPRRVAAMKVAERVASERGERIGRTVGYCIGGERHFSSETALTYCTTGYMLQALVHCPALIEKYTHLILDEIHERSTDADFAMLVVRKLARETSTVRIILMSATMQGSLLVSYFEEVFGFEQVASPYFVGTKRFPVDTYYLDELDCLATMKKEIWNESQLQASATLKHLVEIMPEQGLRQAIKARPEVTSYTESVCTEVVVSQVYPGESVLVFLPGISEIIHYYMRLVEELNERKLAHFFSVFVLHSQIPLDDQKEAFNPPPLNKVHVILATNIAESSITLPKLRMVINFGIYRQLEYNSKRRISTLVKKWCSQASCAQRAGRAGRVFKGIAIHLFTKRFYDVILSEFDPPEILTAPITKLVLQSKLIGKKLGIPSPSEFLSLAIEPPSLQQMEAALQDLADLGAIVSQPGHEIPEEAEITLLGHFSLSLPVDLVLCRLILFGIFFGCPTDAIVMAADMSMTQDVFTLPSRVLVREDEKFGQLLWRSMESRFRYDGGVYSDAIMICKLFRDWILFRITDGQSDDGKPRSKHFLLRRFVHVHGSAIRWERLLYLESLVSEIASRVLVHVPQNIVLYDEMKKLSTLGKYRRQNWSMGDQASGRTLGVAGLDIQFCDNREILKALLAAAFSHQIIFGVREFHSFVPQEKKRAQKILSMMGSIGFNHTRTLAMTCLKQVDAATLQYLVAHVFPRNKLCQTRVVEDCGFVEFNYSFHNNPKTAIMRQQALQHHHLDTSAVLPDEATLKRQALDHHHPDTSVVLQKPPDEATFFWQFGERRPAWRVEGLNAEFSKPRHPCAISWFRVTKERESVQIVSWRNLTGFVCELAEDCSVYLGVVTSLQGSEFLRSMTGKGITVLPSLHCGPSAILMTIAFQSMNSTLQLLMDHKTKNIIGIKLNSQEIVFGDKFCLVGADISRINSLRKALSEALSSSSPEAMLPINQIRVIPTLLEWVLGGGTANIQSEPSPTCTTKKPSTANGPVSDPPYKCASSHPELECKVAIDDRSVMKKRDAGEFELSVSKDLPSFEYYLPLQCSIAESEPRLVPEDVNTPYIFRSKDGSSDRWTSRQFINRDASREDGSLRPSSSKLSPFAKPFVPSVAPSSQSATCERQDGEEKATSPRSSDEVDISSVNRDQSENELRQEQPFDSSTSSVDFSLLDPSFPPIPGFGLSCGPTHGFFMPGSVGNCPQCFEGFPQLSEQQLGVSHQLTSEQLLQTVGFMYSHLQKWFKMYMEAPVAERQKMWPFAQWQAVAAASARAFSFPTQRQSPTSTAPTDTGQTKSVPATEVSREKCGVSSSLSGNLGPVSQTSSTSKQTTTSASVQSCSYSSTPGVSSPVVSIIQPPNPRLNPASQDQDSLSRNQRGENQLPSGSAPTYTGSNKPFRILQHTSKQSSPPFPTSTIPSFGHHAVTTQPPHTSRTVSAHPASRQPPPGRFSVPPMYPYRPPTMVNPNSSTIYNQNQPVNVPQPTTIPSSIHPRGTAVSSQNQPVNVPQPTTIPSSIHPRGTAVSSQGIHPPTHSPAPPLAPRYPGPFPLLYPPFYPPSISSLLANGPSVSGGRYHPPKWVRDLPVPLPSQPMYFPPPTSQPLPPVYPPVPPYGPRTNEGKRRRRKANLNQPQQYQGPTLSPSVEIAQTATLANDMCLLSYFEEYLASNGGEASLKELCGPVFQQYRETSNAVPLFGKVNWYQYFFWYANKFSLFGNPGSVSVRLTSLSRQNPEAKSASSHMTRGPTSEGTDQPTSQSDSHSNEQTVHTSTQEPREVKVKLSQDVDSSVSAIFNTEALYDSDETITGGEVKVQPLLSSEEPKLLDPDSGDLKTWEQDSDHGNMEIWEWNSGSEDLEAQKQDNSPADLKTWEQDSHPGDLETWEQDSHPGDLETQELDSDPGDLETRKPVELSPGDLKSDRKSEDGEPEVSRAATEQQGSRGSSHQSTPLQLSIVSILGEEPPELPEDTTFSVIPEEEPWESKSRDIMSAITEEDPCRAESYEEELWECEIEKDDSHDADRECEIEKDDSHDADRELEVRDGTVTSQSTSGCGTAAVPSCTVHWEEVWEDVWPDLTAAVPSLTVHREEVWEDVWPDLTAVVPSCTVHREEVWEDEWPDLTGVYIPPEDDKAGSRSENAHSSPALGGSSPASYNGDTGSNHHTLGELSRALSNRASDEGSSTTKDNSGMESEGPFWKGDVDWVESKPPLNEPEQYIPPPYSREHMEEFFCKFLSSASRSRFQFRDLCIRYKDSCREYGWVPRKFFTSRPHLFTTNYSHDGYLFIQLNRDGRDTRKRKKEPDTFSSIAVARVENEVVKLLRQNNRTMRLSEIRSDLKLMQLCQLCDVYLFKPFFRSRPHLFVAQELEGSKRSPSNFLVTLRSEAELLEYNSSRSGERQNHTKGEYKESRPSSKAQGSGKALPTRMQRPTREGRRRNSGSSNREGRRRRRSHHRI